MQIPIHWLREWVDVGTDVSALADDLTMAGLEVSAIETVDPLPLKIVIGKILKTESHPSEQTFQICEVDVGRARAIRVICKFRDIRTGTKAAVALPGSALPNGRKVQRVTIGGQVSGGRLCSGADIGIEETAGELLVLDDTARIGQPVTDHLDLNDTILDIELTPNRGDCLSILGVAREIAAIRGVPVNSIQLRNRRGKISSKVPLTVTALTDAPRYLGRVIEGVDVGSATPDWMKERLRRCGLRSLGPIIDITNFVMLELGQPLHAFDFRFVHEGIVVRRARRGESLTLLDGTEIELVPETLLIANKRGPVGLAGIMGGKESGVDARTEAIFLESAYFRPGSIARSTKNYGLQTEASYRFERGVDPAEQMRAVLRASELLTEICGGRLGTVCEVSDSSWSPRKKPTLLRRERVDRVLGANVPENQIYQILMGLNMKPVKNPAGWKVHPPTYRFDVEGEHDLVEEVARLYGFSNLPSRPPHTLANRGLVREEDVPLDRYQDYLIDRDYNEVITYSFVESELQTRIDPHSRYVKLMNPIASNMNVMRTTLWPGLLQSIGTNRRRQINRVRLFETGRVFCRKQNNIIETHRLAAAACGPVGRLHWDGPMRGEDFYDIKGDLEGLLGLDGRNTLYKFVPAKNPALHPGQSAEIRVGSKAIGCVGLLHPDIQKLLDFDFDVYVFEVDFAAISRRLIPVYRSVSRFPSVSRDISVVVRSDVPAAKVENLIREKGGRLLTSVQLFDVYTGEAIKKQSKSLSFGLTLQASSRNLTDKEVEAVLRRIVTALREFGGQLRSAFDRKSEV
jgi:phenylalanyl-tRNA synthetase beta chain